MTARVISDELYVGEHPVLKESVLYVLPVIPDDAPYRIREGIARQRIAAVTGKCPCGATAAYNLATCVGEVTHERRCPASTESLRKAIRRWSA